MPRRWVQKAHFGAFWGPVAKWLLDASRKFILRRFGSLSPNGLQMAPEGSFSSILVSCGQIAARWLQNAHFEAFWCPVAKWLPDGSRRLILRHSGALWPNDCQIAPEGSF